MVIIRPDHELHKLPVSEWTEAERFHHLKMGGSAQNFQRKIRVKRSAKPGLIRETLQDRWMIDRECGAWRASSAPITRISSKCTMMIPQNMTHDAL
jgi:hypothetical protein